MKTQNLVLTFAAYIAQILPRTFRQALYRNPTISKAIRKSLNRAAPEGLNEVTIAAGDAKGLQMLLNLKEEKDYWLGTYEPELQAAIANLVNPGDIVYDIGANIGFMTLLSARQTGSHGHVYAFEALPANVTRLTYNIELNSFMEQVMIIHAAVLDQSGSTDFLIGPSSGMGKVAGSAGRSSIDYENSIQVDGLSIDDFVRNPEHLTPDIVKIDIEGGEILALPGMRKLLREHPPIMLVELHGPEAACVTWEVLNQFQYRICRMVPNYPQVNELMDLDWKSYIVAFPNGG
jgi:FkbM family methyltransferase